MHFDLQIPLSSVMHNDVNKDNYPAEVVGDQWKNNERL